MASRIAPHFSRYLQTVVASAVGAGLAVFTMGMPSSFFELFEPSGIDDMPPAVVLVMSGFVGVAAFVVSLVGAPFRRLIVGPRFPFLRRGYAAVAALPLAWLLHPALEWLERLGAFLAFEVFLALWVGGFVAFGRWIGAFEPEEYAVDL